MNLTIRRLRKNIEPQCWTYALLEVSEIMLEKRTAFILGAGASCPYGFPTARDLRGRIIGNFVSAYEHLLDERRKLGVEGINVRYPSAIAAKDFVTRFDHSSTESIDLFLSRHPGFQGIGKTAICLSILDAERMSQFREHVKEQSKDWYFYLFNRLTRELTGKNGYEEFGKSNIAFVTFNYDRSLEYFLFNSLQHSFEGADAANVEAQIRQLPIVHVYGQVAPLGWRYLEEQNALKYGRDLDDLSAVNFFNVINNVYVVHEERGKPQMEKAREEIAKAERLFFLGFGYAKENREALGLPGVLKAEHDVYGTALGYTSTEIRRIQSVFTQALDEKGRRGFAEQQVKLLDCDCVHLLREFL